MTGQAARIRIAAAEDVEALFDIRTSVHDNYLSREAMIRIGITPASVAEMLATSCRGWMAEIGEKPVAFAMANREEACLFGLFVRPGYEGHGLGRRLLGLAEEWLFQIGCEEIWLLTDARRDVRANGFYRHLGWRDAGPAADGQTRFTRRRNDG